MEQCGADRRHFQRLSGEPTQNRNPQLLPHLEIVGVLEAVEDGQLSPDDLFDRICHEEHLKHCIRLVWSEVLEST